MKKYLQQELDYFAHKSKNFTFPSTNEMSLFTTDERLRDLMESFLTLIGELRQDIEEYPPLILHQLYSSLYGKNINNTGKGIIEIKPDPYYTNPITLNPEDKIISEDCYFTLEEPITIWPIKIKKFAFIRNHLNSRVKSSSSHFLKIQITSLNISIKKMKFTQLRFFVTGRDVQIFFRDLFLNQSRIIAYVTNNQEDPSQDTDLFIYRESVVQWYIPSLSQGVHILQNYCEIPEVYQFFSIENLIQNMCMSY